MTVTRAIDGLILGLTARDAGDQPLRWVAVIVVLLTDLVPVPFLYLAYTAPPEGAWDRTAIDLDVIASALGFWAVLPVMALQVVLVSVRSVRWFWLLIPLAYFVLAGGRYLYVSHTFPAL